MTKSRFITLPEKPCYWCGKNGILARVRKRSVRFFCTHQCGYSASIPKRLIEYRERRYIYQNAKSIK